MGCCEETLVCKDNIRLRGLNPPAIDIYELEGFVPSVVDEAYLRALDLEVTPSPETLAGLERGSRIFAQRLSGRTLIPRPMLRPCSINLDSELEVHNYTGACPTRTFEVSPVRGCYVGCLYCLVSDGSHEQELLLYENYPTLVERVLEEHHEQPYFYYFSAKTEALQEPTLQSGIAHEILRVFIAHFKRHPRSKSRLFVASKAGTRQLLYRHSGERVIDLFAQLAGKMQFNTSVSMMPAALRALLEPYAAPIHERLAAMTLCQEHGVTANAALLQPIIPPYLEDEIVEDFFGRLAAVGVVNVKPEFLTVSMENLAVIGQLLGHHDRDMERALYQVYCAPDNADHKKQRDRTAPDRALSMMWLKRLVSIGRRHGLSTSVCYWLRKELKIPLELVSIINENGFQCLGYQTRLFDEG